MDTYHPHERYVLNDYRHQVEEDAGREPKEQSGCMFLALRAIAKMRPKALNKKLEKDTKFGCENREFDEHEFLCNLVGHEKKVRESQLKDERRKVWHSVDVEKSPPQMEHERRVKTAVRSVLLLECLERSGYFPEGSTEEDRDCVLRRLHDFQGDRQWRGSIQI